MSSPHVYWHIYPQDQVKSALRGGLILILEVPWAGDSPVVRDIVDPTGRDFPTQKPCRFPVLRCTERHGIMYVGVRKQAVFDLMLTEPQMDPAVSTYARYNQQMVSHARNFFLEDPNRAFKAMPQHLVQLL